jgi:glycosyltransferase involved in cell wall biosynthesis
MAIQQNPALHTVKRAAGEKAAKPLILYGAMNAATDRIKGFASLLSALQTLDMQGFEANLVVFGASKSNLPMHFKNISVQFVGFISDTDTLVTLYNLADVMVVPSVTEVFGQTASEALACATPVVCFKTTGIQEVVDHQVCGYVAKMQNAEDLAQGIRWCLENNKDGSLSQAARKKVMENYTIERVGEMYVEVYKAMINKL